ncbi:MAG TPA: DUF445 domain-containing protein [Nitrospira sp.]|nr:DUF445 domain-containing protein [Nitrospira sp.]
MTFDIPDNSIEGRSELVRAYATGLLLGMAGLFVVALIWEPAYPSLSWLRSFAEAAMVGALADWYAVTALFRKPLGLPIPHSQIIPRNKDRIAFRIGSLTQRQLMTPDAIGKLVESWRIPEECTAVLLDPQRRHVMSHEIARVLARMIEASEDAAMRQFTRHIATKMVRGLTVAPLTGQLLSNFLQSPQRDRLIDDALTLAREYMKEHREQLCRLIAEKLPWSRLLNFVNLDEKLAGKIVDWLGSVLRDMREDHDDAVRRRLIGRLEVAAHWLMHSERALQREASIKDKLLTYDALLQFIDESWHSLKQWLLTDLEKAESETRAYLDAALAGLGDQLKTDHDFVRLVQHGLQDVVVDLATRHRDKIGELVTATVRDWSVVHMVQTIEREVGTDLQFIRINGALVGGLVGLLLHGAATLIGKL